jgi:hypothetical protein
MQMKQFAFNLDNVEALWTALFQKKNGTVTRNGANAVPLFRGCTVLNIWVRFVVHKEKYYIYFVCVDRLHQILPFWPN